MIDSSVPLAIELYGREVETATSLPRCCCADSRLHMHKTAALTSIYIVESGDMSSTCIYVCGHHICFMGLDMIVNCNLAAAQRHTTAGWLSLFCVVFSFILNIIEKCDQLEGSTVYLNPFL